MLIVGDDLLNLIQQKQVCTPESYDNTCISLSLGESIIRFKDDNNSSTILDYEIGIPKDYTIKESIGEEGVLIYPQEAIIAASLEKIIMPQGYFGLLQTKGSLARMMMSLHFSDGQIDPGFSGKVTFEVMNGSKYPIRLKKGQYVGNLYIINTSTVSNPPYNGRYQNADGPTIFCK